MVIGGYWLFFYWGYWWLLMVISSYSIGGETLESSLIFFNFKNHG
jgi:hypothetical protein